MFHHGIDLGIHGGLCLGEGCLSLGMGCVVLVQKFFFPYFVLCCCYTSYSLCVFCVVIFVLHTTVGFLGFAGFV